MYDQGYSNKSRYLCTKTNFLCMVKFYEKICIFFNVLEFITVKKLTLKATLYDIILNSELSI